MKILMVNKFLYPNGGSETYIFKLGSCLRALGHEVQYFGMEHKDRCVSNNAQQYTKNMDFHSGSAFKKVFYPLKTIYSCEAKKKMKAVLDDFEPDVIHINNFNYQLTPSILYAAQNYKKASSKKVKIIFTAHDYQLLCPNHMMFDNNFSPCEKCVNGKYTNCFKGSCIHTSKARSLIGTTEATLYKLLKTYKYFDKIICCSEFMKSKMDLNPIFADKTVVMHNFIDAITCDNTKKENYVIYFGRFDKEKGIETIIDCKGIDFICAGSGEYEDKLEKSGHIKNVGFKSGEELAQLIKKAKCSVYPSLWYENCPFSVMESIMYGTPVVGADIGGIPELIGNGKTGYLFKSGDVNDFRDKINKIINDDENAEQMSRNCMETKFDTVDDYCRKLLKIYE